jgi:hypothetical protein
LFCNDGYNGDKRHKKKEERIYRNDGKVKEALKWKKLI